jgi:hypothetical protein
LGRELGPEFSAELVSIEHRAPQWSSRCLLLSDFGGV